MSHYEEEPSLQAISTRLARLESRIVQLMMHLGLHPNKRVYEQTQTSIRRSKRDENLFTESGR